MNIILTGMARSGTTLSCHLLNKLPQCVALHEPMNPAELAGLDFPSGFMRRVEEFFAAQRNMLLSSGKAVTKARGGGVPDNPFDSVVSPNQLRPSTVTNQQVHFAKSLSMGFRLVVKHPNCFTATLEVLRHSFMCFALVRNPLAVLLSWHSIQAPVNDGRLPFGEAFDPTLQRKLVAEQDRLQRQLIILRWYFSRYATHLPARFVIKYEDIIATGGGALQVIDPAAASLHVTLENRNKNPIYNRDQVGELADLLLRDETIYDAFYTRREVEELCFALSEGD